MRYAINPNTLDREEATKESDGFMCPCCQSKVIPKCGSINIHHWAHANLADCDSWSEPEGPWHRKWKSWLAPKDQQEVVIDNHRADCVGLFGVIELQHSPISIEDIQAREECYGNGMVWLFDAQDWPFHQVHHTLWKGNRRRSLLKCKRTVYLDVGGFTILEVVAMDKQDLEVKPMLYSQFIKTVGANNPEVVFDDRMVELWRLNYEETCSSLNNVRYQLLMEQRQMRLETESKLKELRKALDGAKYKESTASQFLRNVLEREAALGRQDVKTGKDKLKNWMGVVKSIESLMSDGELSYHESKIALQTLDKLWDDMNNNYKNIVVEERVEASKLDIDAILDGIDLG